MTSTEDSNRNKVNFKYYSKRMVFTEHQATFFFADVYSLILTQALTQILISISIEVRIL